MKIKFKKLHKDAVLPSHAKEGDAGADLTATRIEILRYDLMKHYYGLAVEIPDHHVGLVFPRSSICNKSERLTNSVAVIDSGYRGEISAVFDAIHSPTYKVRERTAQLVIVPYVAIESEWADELSETERGDGGYGHTGN